MKLLGWMHRKFKQNSSEPLKDSPIGQPSLDDLHYFPKPSYYTKSLSKGQRDCHFRKSFASLEAARVEEEDLEEESSDTCSELFHGFLAIGTLGTEPVIVDPSTPTFSISVDTIAEKETEVTENELKLINDELEKVLGAESKDDGCNLSSGRNSHVSTGRSSHCSTITLSGKPIEAAESNGNETLTCPLQEYLFGSAIELSETTPVAKKEHRTSLGELFQKTKLAEENSGAKFDRGEKRAEKEADKSAVNLMKKMLKKKIPHASSRITGGNTTDSTSAEKKMQKILQMFHRKVHPESSTTEEKTDKTTKNEMKSNVANKGASNKGGVGLVSTGEDIIIFPKRSFSKGSIRGFKNQSNTPQFTISGGDSIENRECWIKTDADYLVLEL